MLSISQWSNSLIHTTKLCKYSVQLTSVSHRLRLNPRTLWFRLRHSSLRLCLGLQCRRPLYVPSAPCLRPGLHFQRHHLCWSPPGCCLSSHHHRSTTLWAIVQTELWVTTWLFPSSPPWQLTLSSPPWSLLPACVPSSSPLPAPRPTSLDSSTTVQRSHLQGEDVGSWFCYFWTYSLFMFSRTFPLF